MLTMYEITFCIPDLCVSRSWWVYVEYESLLLAYKLILPNFFSISSVREGQELLTCSFFYVYIFIISCIKFCWDLSYILQRCEMDQFALCDTSYSTVSSSCFKLSKFLSAILLPTVRKFVKKLLLLFTSPELKAQVIFSDRNFWS